MALSCRWRSRPQHQYQTSKRMRAEPGTPRSGGTCAATSLFRNGPVVSRDYGSGANHEIHAVVCTLTPPVASSVRFSLSCEFGSHSPGSSAFASGQVKRQVTPEGAKSRSTVPSTLRSVIASITMVPNPRRFGADTGGPSRSVQLMVKVSPSVPRGSFRPPGLPPP